MSDYLLSKATICMSSAPNPIHDDFRQRITNREAILIVGAGVSIAASGNSPTASWKGLLESGIDHCVALKALDIPNAENLKRQLDSSDTDLWLGAAQVVERKLKNSSGEFDVWLREKVGSLKATNRAVVEALAQLNLPLFTTNYDGILEEVTGQRPVTWRQHGDLERVVRGELQAIVHLHGYFGDPESVVLGVSSYEDVLRDPSVQSVLRALRTTKTLVFVGFGKGLNDPNFGAFLRWSRIFSQSPYRHFRLARESERDAIQAEHAEEERIFVVSYGHEHADLLPFLASLSPGGVGVAVGPPQPPLPPAGLTLQPTIETFHAEIDLAKYHTAKGEPDVAIALLEKLRTRHSSEFTNRIWYRLLANIARAYDEKEEWEKAAALYLQAKDYEPNNVDAQCFESIAYFLRGDTTRAFALADVIRSQHPQSSMAHAVWLRAAPTTTTFPDLETSIPEHFRSSQDVAHALMFAAARDSHFDKAEVYGRAALAVEPTSPMLLEHLGGVLLDHSRYRLRDIDAEVPPKRARELAEESLDLFGRALAARDHRSPAKTRSRLYMRLAMANEIMGCIEERDRCTRLAYDIEPGNPEVVSLFATNLAAHKEFSAAIALVKGLRSAHDTAEISYLLAILHLARNVDTDRENADLILLSLIPKLDSLSRQAQYQCIRNLLIGCADRGQHQEGESLLSRLTDGIFPPVALHALRAALFRHSGQIDAAKAEALKALLQVDQSVEFCFRQALARELTILQLFPEALSIWKVLVTPQYVGLDIHMTIASALRADDAAFALDFCGQLRSNGFYDPDCILTELEILNKYNCVDTVGHVMEKALSNVEDESFRETVRINRSLLGLENSRPQWVTENPAQLPQASDSSPHLGRAVVQILSSGPDPLHAVHYAYELLRRNFASKDANMAMIGAVLLGRKNTLKIPEADVVEAGIAVAYKEEGAPEPKWWIVEDSPQPERARRELAPNHPLAEKMRGKKVGDEFEIRDGTFQARTATIVEMTSKYVYRFQQCLNEFEEYFPGEVFLMQFSTKRVDSDEPNLEPVFQSIDQKIEWIKTIERDYSKTMPSMNCFAQR